MSHHFDTPTARADPRLNLCDLYLFAGAGQGTTVMAMTVNPAAETTTVKPFRAEAIYAFRFDTDGDRDEDVSFKVSFGDTVRGGADGAGRAQTVEVRRARQAPHGIIGDLLVSGHTNDVVLGPDRVRVYAGVVEDAFAGDAAALEAFKAAFAKGRYEPEAFENRVDFFNDRTVAAVVVEVPNVLIANTIRVNAWATISLHGHAPEQQVARWGLPLLTHVFLGDDDLCEHYNRSTPADDQRAFTASTASTVSRYAAMAGTVSDPEEYGRRVASMFGSFTLPYDLGSVASFDFAGINGRSLNDNVMDNMLTLLTNSALSTGIRPDRHRFTETFPYVRPARQG